MRGLRSMMEPAKLSTTLLIREVENGYLIDVDVEGGPVGIGSPEQGPRFVKFVVHTMLELEVILAGLLEQLEKREPHPSDRIRGNLQMRQINQRVMIISRLDGGYIVETAEPIQVKINNEAMRRISSPVRSGTACDEVEEAAPSVYIDVEQTKKIIVSMDDIKKLVTLFFGEKGIKEVAMIAIDKLRRDFVEMQETYEALRTSLFPPV